MAYEFRLPDIGEGVYEGEIVQWLVQPGDVVQEDQSVVEVMTDKVTAEIPAPVSGVVKELRGQPGETIPVGAVLLLLETSPSASREQAARPADKRSESKSEARAEMQPADGADKQTATLRETQSGDAADKERTAASLQNTQTARNGSTAADAGAGSEQTQSKIAMAVEEKPLAAPATRKLARTLGVTLNEVRGSGPHGRITQADVQRFQAERAESKTAGASGAAVEPGRGDRRVPFTGMRRKIAAHLTESKRVAPHFAYVEEVDMSRLVTMREELLPVAEAEGLKLSYLPFVIKAVIAGLQRYPVLNSQLDEAAQELVYKADYHMGVAVATEQGLIVPVIRHADRKTIFTLAKEIQDLAQRARAGKLTLPELKGGTFTLTSIGSIGGLFSVPIINHPEVAILGVNRIEKRPVVRMIDGAEQIVARHMMNLSISCDHRVVDGAEAALFVKAVIEYLESPARLMAIL